jgi:tetratricopeptide (TPR) repeat protein
MLIDNRNTGGYEMEKLTVFLTCLVFFSFGAAYADEDSSADKVRDLCMAGDSLFDSGEYEDAVDVYLEAVTYPEADKWKDLILYAVGSSYSLIGEADSAIEYLDSSIEAGFTDFRRLNSDPNFKLLRETSAKKFARLVDRAIEVKSKEIEENTPLYVVQYDNYSGPVDVAQYDWEDINRPELDTLREEYQLREVFGTDGTEFDKMKRLLNWVATRWIHDGSKMAPVRTGLAILREVDRGGRFCCANYADVLIDCMRALGYPIRFVGLRMADAAYNMGGGHGCVEVWSNQYQKWIFLDVQNNAWWEHNGRPLSAYECHKLFVNGKEDELQFIGQHEGRDYSQMKSDWIGYFYCVINYWMGSSLQLVSDEVTPQLVYQGGFQDIELTDQYDRVYPRLNRTRITLKHDWSGPFDTLAVTLDHTMPYFDHFLVRIDEMDWEEAGDSLAWLLNDGINSIEAKAVSTVGVEGRSSRIVLRENSANAN